MLCLDVVLPIVYGTGNRTCRWVGRMTDNLGTDQTQCVTVQPRVAASGVYGWVSRVRQQSKQINAAACGRELPRVEPSALFFSVVAWFAAF